MATKWWIKELLNNPLRVPAGFKVEFEDVGGNVGVLATDDGYLNSELQAAFDRKVGGVYEISKEKYESLKKNNSHAFKSRKSLVSVLSQASPRLHNPLPEKKQESVAEVEVGQPLNVPDSIPTTKKVSELSKRKPGRPPKSRIPVSE